LGIVAKGWVAGRWSGEPGAGRPGLATGVQAGSGGKTREVNVNTRQRWLGLGLALTWVASVAFAVAQGPSFPHEDHQKLFRSCTTGCHEGVAKGNRAAFYPDPAMCGKCHNGKMADPVTYSGNTPKKSTLKYSHPDHPGDLKCVDCHVEKGATAWNVKPATATGCWDCHEGTVATHQVSADCTVCHNQPMKKK
jgi:hypothetical protein